ncbi:MAG: hypothetical protein A2792_00065 [Sphingomonadales bacterium RIFCSPHIGHO2_01_FULL_65_20]|nr:MAG: hypothetical protein A2792_00065 [Sphingomonadales bacterium RIFCSPHIGHO2_01_FULL_65_20]
MSSLAQRRRAQVLAERAAADAGEVVAGVAAAMPETGQAASEYNLLRAVLHSNLQSLAEIQSVEARNPKKAEMAKAFDAWVAGVLEAGQRGAAAQDEILVTMMIWALDCRDIDRALDLAAHAIKHGLALPERYTRKLGCFVAEDIAEAWLADAKDVTREQLLRTQALTEKADMPDQARAKLLKALGRTTATAAGAFDPTADNAPAGGKAGLLDAAKGYFEAALKLNKNIGVKKELEAVDRELKQLAEAAGTNET